MNSHGLFEAKRLSSNGKGRRGRSPGFCERNDEFANYERYSEIVKKGQNGEVGTNELNGEAANKESEDYKEVRGADRPQKGRHLQPPSAICGGGVAEVVGGSCGLGLVCGAELVAGDDRLGGVSSPHQMMMDKSAVGIGIENKEFDEKLREWCDMVAETDLQVQHYIYEALKDVKAGRGQAVDLLGFESNEASTVDRVLAKLRCRIQSSAP